ncbi:MAG TPA: TlpA disulfide reductase family protein [Sulfuriferula sp.]|nr:TlpA disulfide reductase family protein [Sulfuriferula sp.]
MQYFVRIILAGVLIVTGASQALANSLRVGAAAPAFTVKTLDGRALSLASLHGKVVLLNFWATWCPPCRAEMPALERFYQLHRNEGLEIIAVSMEDRSDEAKVRTVAAAYTYPLALIANAEVEDYGRIWRLPLTFVIDRAGMLRKSDWSGEQPISAASLDEYVLPYLKTPVTN